MKECIIVMVNDKDEIIRTFESKYLMIRNINKLIKEGFELVNIIVKEK